MFGLEERKKDECQNAVLFNPPARIQDYSLPWTESVGQKSDAPEPGPSVKCLKRLDVADELTHT